MTALRQDAEAAAGGLLALHKRDDEFCSSRMTFTASSKLRRHSWGPSMTSRSRTSQSTS